MSDALERLFRTIEARKGADPKSSYTAKLLAGGTQAITAKVTEEAGEVVRAAEGEGKARLIAESGDLLYHLLVLWADGNVRPDEVWAELARREGTSGIEEKNSRPKR
ncbi:MAG: hisE [Rhodospirillales bacterium]|nr:hisE [Rhodospirillales bacterium]